MKPWKSQSRESEEPRIVMAFDFGIKHIGIAIGQEITKTASTFYSIKALEGQPDWNELDDIIHEWKPDLIVVGDPYNMDGSRSKIQDMSDRFSDASIKDIKYNWRRLMRDYPAEKPMRGYKILILEQKAHRINTVSLRKLF